MQIRDNSILSKCASNSGGISSTIMFMNILCFNSASEKFSFDSLISKNYDNFLLSVPLITVRLYYYNFKPAIYKIIFILDENNTQRLPFEFPNQNFMSNSMKLGNNYKHAFLAFSSDGVILSDSPYNQVNSVIYSFNYEDIRDCEIETVNKNLVFAEEKTVMPSNECCVSLEIMRKDLSITSLILCSYTFADYECNLEINYIRLKLYDNCPCKLLQSLIYAFDNGISLSETILSKYF